MSEIDEAVFGGLVELGPEIVADLVTTYCDDSTRLERALVAAVAARDAGAVARAAHDLKSTSAALGALGVQRLAAAVEHGGRTGDLAPVDALTEQLSAALAAARGALRARI